MGRKANGIKYGGRAKGVINRKTEELFKVCEEEGVDVFRGLLRLAKSSGEESIRLKAYCDLMKYLYPQRKAVELSSDSENGFKIVVEDYVSKK